MMRDLRTCSVGDDGCVVVVRWLSAGSGPCLF